MYTKEQIKDLQKSWKSDPRWEGITRPYTAEEVIRLRGSIQIEHTLARRGADRLWQLLKSEPFIRRPGSANWRPGRRAGTGRFESHLP